MKPPRVPVVLEEGFAVACMALLVLITLANVLTRYFTDQSFAWTEEISIFLMVVMTLAGASAAAARDRHIRIEFFYEGGSAARRRLLTVAGALATGLFFLGLALLFSRVVADELRYGETTMGLGVPRWWYTAWMPLLAAALGLRCLGAAWRAAARAHGEADAGPADRAAR
jgi:TRAP-type C4-dicarboxylate transport system permease small subunit